MDEIERHTTAERQVAVMMKTSGWKLQNGGEIDIPDPGEARTRFDQMLTAPLDQERKRERMLRLVRSI